MKNVINSITTVEELIEALNNINYDWFRLTNWYGISMTVFDNKHPEVKRVADACSSLLRNDDGSVNSDVADAIRAGGYGVIAYDDSGIISGSIDRKSGMHSELHFGNANISKNPDKQVKNPDNQVLDDLSAKSTGPDITTLVTLLNDIYSKKDTLIKIVDCNEDDDLIDINKKFFDSDNDEVSKAIILCNSLLIGNGGECNWENISDLRTYGFRVYAGESDSFGWLSGCVEKNGSDTILVFG